MVKLRIICYLWNNIVSLHIAGKRDYIDLLEVSINGVCWEP